MNEDLVEIGKQDYDVFLSRGSMVYDRIGSDITVSRKHLTSYKYKDNVCKEDLGSLDGIKVHLSVKGLYRLYTSKEKTEEDILTEPRICIEPEEEIIVVLAPFIKKSELEQIIKKFKDIICKESSYSLFEEDQKSIKII